MKLHRKLDRKLKLAQEVFELTREVKVNAARAIAAVHDGRKVTLDRKKKRKLDSVLKKHPEALVFSGSNAMLAYQEYGEAAMLISIVKNNRLAKVDIPPASYLTALGDVTGELKRRFLEELINGNETEAKRLLRHAVKIKNELSTYDYPDYIVPGLRRKKDQARYTINSMLETLAKSHSASK